MLQVLRQFPTRFEFTERLLVTLADAAFSCRFGDFLFNTERERMQCGIMERTPSFWADVRRRRSVFENKAYVPPSAQQIKDGDAILWSVVCVRK